MRVSFSRMLVPSLLMAAFATSCNNGPEGKASPGQLTASKPVDSSSLTTIQWLDSTKNFGKIEEGQKLEVAFRFKNTGDKPLVIERVQPSCGCTVAEQSTEPVAAGQEGQIKATFNSEGRAGINHKTLFVYANTKDKPSYDLHFEVEVEKKK